MNLVLQTVALHVRNKGGLTGGKPTPDKQHSGSDYVTFICPNPSCKHRNKQSMYGAQGYIPSNESWIPFKCTMCRTMVEVTPPVKTESLIMAPGEYTQQMAQRRRDLTANRVLGRT